MATADSSTDDAPTPVYEEMEDGAPRPVGVKLGSTRTMITTGSGKGIDVAEFMTRIAEYEDVLTGDDRRLYGEEAEAEYPDRVEPIIETGLPDNYRTELAKEFFDQCVRSNDIPKESVVVYAVPSIENEEGLSNLESVIKSCQIGESLVRSYPESLCGAIPAVGDGLDALDETFVAINLGSTYFEAGTYRHGEQLTTYASESVTGNWVDKRIASYVKRETDGHVEIDPRTAREYKENHADFDNFQPFSDAIPQPSGGPFEFTIEDAVMDAMDDYLDKLIGEFVNGFLPEFANEYRWVFSTAMSNPIILTGGMACVPGIVEEFERRLMVELQGNVNAIAPPQPDRAAAMGAHRMAYRLVQQGAY